VGFSASPQDLAKRYAPVIYGIVNACGCLAGALAVYLTGLALQAFPEGEGFAVVFRVAALVYCLGAVSFCTTYTGSRDFD